MNIKILLAVIVLFAVTACGTENEGPLVVGTNVPYEPMEFHDASGNLVGLDIDIMWELGLIMGREVTFKEYGWEELFLAVENGEVDLAISSISITLEREEKYEFSLPYFNAGQVLVTAAKTDSPDIIGVQGGTTSEEEAKKLSSEVRIYPDYSKEAIDDLKSGEIDALMLDVIAAESLIKQNPELMMSQAPITNEYYGIMAKKGNDELIGEVDDALQKMKSSGKIEEIKRRWI